MSKTFNGHNTEIVTFKRGAFDSHNMNNGCQLTIPLTDKYRFTRINDPEVYECALKAGDVLIDVEWIINR